MADILIFTNNIKPLTSLMYGWSKYGGSNFGLVGENIDLEWDCQACGSEQEGDPYDFEFAPREFIKICDLCHMLKVKYNVITFVDLIELVRAKHGIVEYLSIE